MSEDYTFGQFRLSVDQRLLRQGGSIIEVEPRAFDILVALLRSDDNVVSSDDLSRIAWPNEPTDERLLRVHIKALCKILDRTSVAAASIVATGEGYRFTQALARDRPEDGLGLPSAPLSEIKGRDDIVRSLSMMLPRTLSVTVTGAGGAGKSVVAQAVAELARDEFQDGIFFLDMERHPTAAYHHPPEWSEAREGFVRGFLGNTAGASRRRSIVILDGCERFQKSACQIIASVRRIAPLTAVIATSREPLSIEQENVRMLAALEFPIWNSESRTDRGDLLSYPAAALFVERVRASIGSFEIDAEIHDEIVRISEYLEGNPLAIELAAACVDQFGLLGLTQLVSADLNVLSAGRRTAPDRQKSIFNSIKWSFDLLDANERLALRAFAFLTPPFSAESARSLLSANRSIQGDSQQIIRALVSKSLLVTDRPFGTTRYRLPRLAAQFCRR